MLNGKTIDVGGLTRCYLAPFSMEAEIPDVRKLIKDPLEYEDFIEHVFSNYKSRNWKIFRYRLNKTNYKAFLYAFAFDLGRHSPYLSTSWQVDSNARRLKKAIIREGISLSDAEQRILEISLNFKGWWYPENARKTTSLQLQHKIAEECGLLSEHII